MAQSFFGETFVIGKDNIPNNIRHKKIKDKILVTTDHGAWAFLEEHEFKQLIKNELSDELFKILEEKGIIITKNNMEKIIDEYKKRYHFLSNGVSLHIIVPTLRCNHKCVYCHSSAKNSEDLAADMDKNTAKKTLEFIFQTPAKSITIEFQGGDALINYELFKYIVMEAKEMNNNYGKDIRFSLVTNLTLMNEEIVEFLYKEKINLCTSLDGPKNVHDKNRKMENNKPSYDEVTKWINLLKQKYNWTVSALMVTTRHSMPYWKEIVDEYTKLGISSLQIKYINKLGFAEKQWKEIGYTIDEFIDFWEKSVDYMLELNKKGIKIKSRFVSVILNKILLKYDPNFLDMRSPCGIVSGQLAYNYNGDIFCCDEGRNFEIFKLGNVKENNYKEVLTAEKSQGLISASINDNLLCDNCVYKPFCGVCPVLAYAEDNNILPNLGKNNRCKLFKFQFDYTFNKLLGEEKEILFKWVDYKANDMHFHSIKNENRN